MAVEHCTTETQRRALQGSRLCRNVTQKNRFVVSFCTFLVSKSPLVSTYFCFPVTNIYHQMLQRPSENILQIPAVQLISAASTHFLGETSCYGFVKRTGSKVEMLTRSHFLAGALSPPCPSVFTGPSREKSIVGSRTNLSVCVKRAAVSYVV